MLTDRVHDIFSLLEALLRALALLTKGRPFGKNKLLNLLGPQMSIKSKVI